MNIFRKSLRRKLVSSFLVLSLSIVCLAGYTAFVQSTDALRRSVIARLDNVARAKEMQLNDWVIRQCQDLELLSRSPEVQSWSARLLAGDGQSAAAEAKDSLREYFDSALKIQPDLGEIFLMTAVGGKTVLSTRPSREGLFHLTAEFFTQGKQGMFVQRVYPSLHTSRPTMTVSLPVKSRGAVLGVLAANVDLTRMDKIIQESGNENQAWETYLVDKFNVFVSSERYGRDDFPRGVHTAGINTVVQGRDGSGQYHNYSGVPVLGVYRWLENFDLGLLSEVPQEVAFAPARQLSGNILLIGLGTVLALALGINWLSRRIAHPILAISETASQVAEGDLSQRIDIRSHDEVGVLATSFNRMTAQLQRLYQTLENQIADLESTRVALDASEKRFRQLVEGVPDGIAILDGLEIMFLNGAGARLFCVRESRILQGQSILSLACAKDRERLASAVQKMQGDQAFCFLEASFDRMDKSVMEAEVTLLPFVHQGKDGMQMVIKDVTDRNRADREKKRLEDQLQQTRKMEALGVLAGGIAHDFNNLLHAMSGYVQLLQKSKTSNDQEARYLGEVAASAERASDLVKMLLTFSRKMEASPRPVDLNNVVERTVRLLERTIPKMITIQSDLHPKVPSAMVDPVHVEQILMNLCMNAVDAMENHGTLSVGTGSVSTEEIAASGLEQGAYVLLTVADTGSGMDDHIQSHMYEPFFTTKEVGQGTGLGLATVYGIVTSYKGHIGCESSPGKGTSFTVVLPAGTGHEESREIFSAIQEDCCGGKEAILVVDDEEHILEIATDILEQYGYTVLTAKSGEEALGVVLAGNHEISLVMLDLGMPGMGGERCLEELGKKQPSCKVIVCSGYAAHKIGSNPHQYGASAFLRKPYSLNEMVVLVRKVLDGPPPHASLRN